MKFENINNSQANYIANVFGIGDIVSSAAGLPPPPKGCKGGVKISLLGCCLYLYVWMILYYNLLSTMTIVTLKYMLISKTLYLPHMQVL